MEKELNEFKIEVLTQLAVINSKLDSYNKTQEKDIEDIKETKEIALEAENRSKQNEEDIKDIKDTNKWAFRTSVGAIITSTIGLVFLFIKLGIGIK